MTSKPNRPGRQTAQATPKVAKPPRPSVAGTLLRQAETRWQRTARYGWDKGGSKGGR